MTTASQVSEDVIESVASILETAARTRAALIVGDENAQASLEPTRRRYAAWPPDGHPPNEEDDGGRAHPVGAQSAAVDGASLVARITIGASAAIASAPTPPTANAARGPASAAIAPPSRIPGPGEAWNSESLRLIISAIQR